MRVIIIYYSRSGTTKEMAEVIAGEIKKRGVDVDITSTDKIAAEDILRYDGIIVGSPTYYGNMASQIKKLFDDSVSFHGKLDGKIGGAFSSSANLAGGNETTILSIVEAMLIHGMIIQGDYSGDHYGPVALNDVDSRCRKNCIRFAQRFIKLIGKITG